MNLKNLPKLYVSPISKIVTDTVIDFVNKSNINIGFILSRRQLDTNGGYLKEFAHIEEFFRYVKSRNKNIPVCQDHASFNQGTERDYEFDLQSLREGSEFLDITHIDPFKLKSDIEGYAIITNLLYRDIRSFNHWISYDGCNYEVGTEEAIFKYNSGELKWFLDILNFNPLYTVIQPGTSLKNNINTGVYNKEELIKQLDVVHAKNSHAKLHNGDFLDLNLISEKFKLGLDAINICPELAQIQTHVLLNNVDDKIINYWYQLCLDSGVYKKWIDDDFNILDKERVLLAAGHYEFNDKIIYPLTQNLEKEIRSATQLWLKNHLDCIYSN